MGDIVMGWMAGYNDVEVKIANKEPLSIHEVLTEGQRQVLELPIENKEIVCVSGEISNIQWNIDWSSVSGSLPTTQAVYKEEEEEIREEELSPFMKWIR